MFSLLFPSDQQLVVGRLAVPAGSIRDPSPLPISWGSLAEVSHILKVHADAVDCAERPRSTERADVIRVSNCACTFPFVSVSRLGQVG